MIKAAQRLGFTLDEVCELLEASQRRRGDRSDAGLQTRASAKLVEVDAKISDLNEIRATLLAALDAGCDDLATCAVNPYCPVPIVETAVSTEQTRE